MRSVPESPASSQRPFDFADLGRPMPKSVRTLPPAPPAPPARMATQAPHADATGQLEELSGDDILESDEWHETDRGTPQGAGISPLLANVFLHYVLDL